MDNLTCSMSNQLQWLLSLDEADRTAEQTTELEALLEIANG